MRVLFWKFHCPSFICFCKSSPLSLSNPCSLELESAQHVVSTVSSLSDVNEDEKESVDVARELPDANSENEKERLDVEVESDVPPRSSLKKPSASGSKETEKGKVQWLDFLGKELVEIREFEPSESGESDDDINGNRGCVCVIQ